MLNLGISGLTKCRIFHDEENVYILVTLHLISARNNVNSARINSISKSRFEVKVMIYLDIENQYRTISGYHGTL